jgi:hypothetical protein
VAFTTSVKLSGAAFRSRGDWTLGAMAEGEGVTDDAPFFMQPSVNLRGVPTTATRAAGRSRPRSSCAGSSTRAGPG